MRLVDFVACDDIRHELGNKMSIIGAYNDAILLSPRQPGAGIKWPAALRFAVYVRLLYDERDEVPNAFQFIVSHQEKEIAILDGEMQIGAPARPLQLALVIPLLSFPGPGKIGFKIIFKKDATVVSEIIVDRPLSIGVVPPPASQEGRATDRSA